MEKCIQKLVKILFVISFLFILCIPIHVNAISTDDLDKSGDIGYMRMKLFIKENPNEIIVHLLKNDSGEIIDLYTYPQDDYIIDATLPVGQYTVQDISSKEEISFDIGQTFTIEKNGIATVKIPQSKMIFEDFDEPLPSDGIGENISLISENSNKVVDTEEIGDNEIQPRDVETNEIALYAEDTEISKSTQSENVNKIIIIGACVIVGIIGTSFVFKKKKKEEKTEN